jgi:N utilization substance protein B
MRGGRRQARSLAFQTLFELESRTDRPVEEALRDRVDALREETGDTVDKRSLEFARQLVLGTLAERADIDRRIGHVAPQFPVEQAALTDRVALEIALFELLYAHTASDAVVINEAVELAKMYGGESSGRFVNGVLGTIAEELSVRGGARPSNPSSHHTDQDGRR